MAVHSASILANNKVPISDDSLGERVRLDELVDVGLSGLGLLSVSWKDRRAILRSDVRSLEV
jgi:hypothetical protein